MHPVCQETPKSHQLLISLLNQTTVSIVSGVTSFQHLRLISQIVCSYANCKLDLQFQDFEINSRVSVSFITRLLSENQAGIMICDIV